MNGNKLSVAVIGAGPVGLAAAAHLVSRGLKPVIFERGEGVGHAMKSWGHVRVFSPWSYNIDSASRALLEQTDWIAPVSDQLPTGTDLINQYLEPLSRHPQIQPGLKLQAEVISIARNGVDKLRSSGRENSPFVIIWRDSEGAERRTEVSAVIDSSGTWFSPNPMGADGSRIEGEQKNTRKIAYGIPNVLGSELDRYANKRVLVLGAGHSAINVILDLLKLQQSAPQTKVIWSLRRNRLEKLFGGGLNDKLPARGALGEAAKKAIAEKRLELLVPFAATKIEAKNNHLIVSGLLDQTEVMTVEADQIVVATGFRPNLDMLRELRISLDPALEAPPTLAPLIDPSVHSCGTVPPHGAEQLRHPSEPGFYIVGSKSYGRAPTFLMATGYEQVRSVVAEIAGDHEAAKDVRLVLPETGVCSSKPTQQKPSLQIQEAVAKSSCCGGPSPANDGACCLKDHDAKEAGEEGCGCGKKNPETIPIIQQTTTQCCATA